jgi:hypothetical protein
MGKPYERLTPPLPDQIPASQRGHMRQNLTLTVSSLLTIALSMLHITDDTLHAKEGIEAVGTIIILLIMLVMLIGTVDLAGRRWGFVITLFGGLGAMYMPFLHPLGPHATRWGFFFVWTLIAMGVIGAYTALLSARGLWRSYRTARLA